MRQLLAVAALLVTAQASAAIPSAERDALLAVYQSTNGPSWTNRDGWGGAPGSECDWHGVTCDETNSNVIYLELYDNNLSGTLPAAIGNLTKLRSLQIWNSDLHGPLPAELGQLSELQSLYASSNHLSGTIPAQLGNLKKLEYLYLDGNELVGPLPSELGNLPALIELGLSYNRIDGELPPQLANLTNLTLLELSVNRLTGEIPAGLGQLQKLERFGVVDNQLTGDIPPQLGNATALQSLRLGYNQLTGTIPATFAQLTNLQYLDLLNNRLTGSIPELSPTLIHLDMTSNDLSGPLPTTLWTLTNLEELYLGDNAFTGQVPAQIGNLTKLQVLSLYQNQLTGAIPPAITTLAAMRSLELQMNDFSGLIPPELANLTNLTWLDLAGNALTGNIPRQLGTLPKLEVLSLYDNQLQGNIPPELGALSKLSILYLGQNQLIGTIPDALRSLTSLQQFSANGNRLTGSIPVWIGEWTQLTDFFVSYNQLTGTLPPSLETLSNLQYLDVGENRLTGSLPDFSRLTNLRYVTAQFNEFTGTIPPSIGQTRLYSLSLDNNALSGAIPKELGNLTDLEYVSLTNNAFDGPIPPELGNLKKLYALSLWGNRLSGTIPKELGGMSGLLFLDLSFNALRGPVPHELTQLTALEANRSDFSYNALFANDPAISAFLNAKQYDGHYELTQTVTPKNVRVVATTDRNATIAWTPIEYHWDNGGYQVIASTTPNGPPAAVATTNGKELDSIIVRNLAPSTNYFFRVAAVTHPGAYQDNLLISDDSAPVQAATGPRVLAPPDVALSDPADGMVQIDGVEAGEDSFTVTNYGDVATSITLERCCDFFTVTPQQFPLAPGASQVVQLRSTPQPNGTYYGHVAIHGEGAPDDLNAYVVLLATSRPAGSVVAEPLATRVELAGAPGSDSVGIAQFRNTGTAQLTGVVVSDQPWVEVPAETITIDPGTIGTVNFRVVRAKRPTSEGTLTANLSLVYVSGATGFQPVGALATNTPINVSKVTIVDITKPPVTPGTIPPLTGDFAFFIPGILGGSATRSDVSIINARGSRSIDDLRLYFTRQSTTNVATLQPLPLAKSVNLVNVLGSVYSTDGTGTLQIRSNSGASLGAGAKATAVTPEGTFTGAIPVFRADRSISTGQRIYLAGVAQGADLFLQEVSGAAGTLRIDFLDAGGNVLSSRNESLTAFAFTELRGIVPANTATIVLENTGASFFTAYARLRDASGDTWSVVDWSGFYGYRRTEAVRVPFADGRTASSGGGKRRSVRTMAEGRSTDVVIFNPTTSEVRATLQIIEMSGRSFERTVTIAPRATITLANATSGTGSPVAHLVLTPTRGELAVTARTHDADSGSAIPVVAATSGLRLGQRQVFSGLEHTNALRTAYGLVETSGAATTKVRARIVFDTGSALYSAATEREFTLGPREQVFVGDLVGSSALGELHGVVLEIEVVAGGGAIVPFVMTTDAGTGDVSIDIP